METCLAIPSKQCRFLGTPITQSRSAQAPGLLPKFNHRSTKWLAFGDRTDSANPMNSFGTNTSQNGFSGQAARLSKDGWIFVDEPTRGAGEKHMNYTNDFGAAQNFTNDSGAAQNFTNDFGSAQPGCTFKELHESLQGAVGSLQEFSSALQRVSWALNDSLTRSHTASHMESIENQYFPQSGPNNYSMQSGDHGYSSEGQTRNHRDAPHSSTQEYRSAEQNGSAVSDVAFRLQQAFVQARVNFLGKPFQVALEEFVDCTMQAHAMGVDLLTLQLQVLLAERAGYSNELAPEVQEKVTMEGHIRAMWVRQVYITLNHVNDVRAAKQAGARTAQIQIDPAEDLDGQGHFVQGIIDQYLGQGLTLDRLRLQQAYAEKTDSPAVEALQQSHYLILMTLAKALGEY